MVEATFVQDGHAIDYTPAAAVAAGVLVLLGNLVGIAKRPIAAGELGALHIPGVFDVAKSGSTGPVFVVGDVVLFDTVNRLAVRVGASGSGVVELGTCVAAAGTSDTTVRVRQDVEKLPPCMRGKVWEDVTLAGGSKTLDAEDIGKVINITVGHASNVVTLPATAAGLGDFVIRAGVSGGRIAVSPAAADKFLGANLAGTDNKDRILAAATGLMGDYIELTYGGADGYAVKSERGVWAQEP